jgi:hypothetical protein
MGRTIKALRTCLYVAALAMVTGIAQAENKASNKAGQSEAAGGAKAEVEYKVDLRGQSVPCWSEVKGASNQGCKTMASCPAPNNSKSPVVTCHQPQWVFRSQDPVVHVYGKHLVNEDGPPKLVAYRDTDSSGPMAQITREITVHSPCHLSFKLHIKGMMGLACGDSVEFRIVREPRAPGEPRSATVMTDWRTFKVTEKAENAK